MIEYIDKAYWDTLSTEQRAEYMRQLDLLDGRKYTTGAGQVLGSVHPRAEVCFEEGCSVHNPTDPHQAWPTHWWNAAMWRQCPHGVLHPDRDHITYLRREYGEDEARERQVHNCDGCCTK